MYCTPEEGHKINWSKHCGMNRNHMFNGSINSWDDNDSGKHRQYLNS